MSGQRIFGFILVVFGVVLFIVGLNASDSVADQVSSFFTGHFTDATVWYLLGGVVLAIVGGMMSMHGGSKSAS